MDIKNPNMIDTLDALIAKWRTDATEIDLHHPDKDAAKITNLHQDYITIKAIHNRLVKQNENKLKRTKHILWQYFRGDIADPEELKEHDLEPIQKRINKTDVDQYVNSHERVLNLQWKIDNHKEIVSYCDSVLKALSDRGWLIKHVIDWAKLEIGA